MTLAKDVMVEEQFGLVVVLWVVLPVETNIDFARREEFPLWTKTPVDDCDDLVVSDAEAEWTTFALPINNEWLDLIIVAPCCTDPFGLNNGETIKTEDALWRTTAIEERKLVGLRVTMSLTTSFPILITLTFVIRVADDTYATLAIGWIWA